MALLWAVEYVHLVKYGREWKAITWFANRQKARAFARRVSKHYWTRIYWDPDHRGADQVYQNHIGDTLQIIGSYSESVHDAVSFIVFQFVDTQTYYGTHKNQKLELSKF